MAEPPDVSPLIHQTLLGDAWEHAAIAVAIFSDDGRYLACNQAFCRLTGYQRAQITELQIGVDLGVDERNVQLFREIVSNRRTTGSGPLRRADGSTVTVNFWAIETRASSLPYFIVLYWPASERPKRRLFR